MAAKIKKGDTVMVIAGDDHGRTVAEVFRSAARKETDAYQIKDVHKLLAVAPLLGVEIKVKDEEGNELDRDIDEIAVEVADAALSKADRKAAKQFANQQGTLYMRMDAPANRRYHAPDPHGR